MNYLPLASTPPGYGYISGTVLNGTGIQGASATTNTSNTTTADASGFYYFLVPASAYLSQDVRLFLHFFPYFLIWSLDLYSDE